MAEVGRTSEPVPRRGLKVTIDVAAAGGVSRATVSRVITGAARVSAGTRARVLAVIAELGYRPDTRSRSLAGGHSGVVGLLTEGLCSSYVTEIMRHFDAALAAYDLQRRRFPHVLVDVDPRSSASAAVTFDNSGGMAAAVEHLRSLGHRRFGFVTGDLGSADARERLDAFHRALAASGVPSIDRVVTRGDWCEPSGYEAGVALLSLPVPPTAVVVSNDLEGLGVLRAARALGVRVPTELSIVGCDDIPEAAVVHPGLTTIRQPLSDIGRTAARLLYEQITAPRAATPLRRLRGQLVVRETTAPAPA